MPSRRATIADVAARAGLSKTAVSMILNERPGSRLSAEAIARARAAAEELGYRPNPAAKSLRSGRTETIGFISDEVTITRYASALIRGALDAADELDHTVLMAETGHEPARQAAAISSMLDRRADGVIFAVMGAKEIDVPAGLEGVPLVLLNAISRTGESTVLPDESESGYAIARELLSAGHRRVALIGAYPERLFLPRFSATIGARFAGLRRAFEAASVTPVFEAAVEPWEPAVGYAAAQDMLALDPLPTGVVCLNDRIAFGVYQALSERGLRIPDDISVVSFDDDEIAEYLRPGLTTARIPYEEMGRAAVEILLSGDLPQHRLIPMPIVRRSSVRRIGEPA